MWPCLFFDLNAIVSKNFGGDIDIVEANLSDSERRNIEILGTLLSEIKEISLLHVLT